ncbi:uncharacterized protein FOMMEDRAFT_161433 [Fomitiporia mediterranea MF3/22]|uniref:uncharacterized protein n=1 Tax=Fomitiporia mediterranea (strain MF3/22) TaxID=694068 RepID=UPI00044094DA|nr:uncharacterized protein FOMMEDRAFT_161433 [Fomitiporia mediterranea MF3/22]EJC98615.1 hypothetical protein FOMMEDRAFT_161433 [Fomitiporia mediterranea MF3/22]
MASHDGKDSKSSRTSFYAISHNSMREKVERPAYLNCLIPPRSPSSTNDGTSTASKEGKQTTTSANKSTSSASGAKKPPAPSVEEEVEGKTPTATNEATRDDTFGSAAGFDKKAEDRFKRIFKKVEVDHPISGILKYVSEQGKNDRTLIVGRGKDWFSTEDMNSGKIITYTAKPQNVLALLGKKMVGYKRPCIPRKDNEAWKVSITFDKDDYDLVELHGFDRRVITYGQGFIEHLKDTDYVVKDGKVIDKNAK